MHRSSLVIILWGYSCLICGAEDTWWNNLMTGGETRTTSTWTKSNPVVQLSVSTAMNNKRKLKPTIATSAQTPQKFWESKSFEALLRENQKDGLDIDHKTPFRQSFKSWEFTKEGDKPGKLIEKSWEKAGDLILVPPTVKIIENTDRDIHKVNSWSTTPKQPPPPIRWDDKVEFANVPKAKKKNIQIIRQQDFIPENREKPKVKLVAKKLVTLKKTLETEEIPIDGIINSKHESTRLIKKEGIVEQPPIINNNKKPLEKNSRIWFKMPSTTADRPTTPQVEYAVEEVPLPVMKRSRRPQPQLNLIKIQHDTPPPAENRSTRPPATGTPKLSYRFEWGKRSDEDLPKYQETPNSENLKKEEPPEPYVEPKSIDEELDDIKELDEFKAKWEGLARKTFKDNEETTTQTPQFSVRPTKAKIERSNRRAVKLKDNVDEFDKSDRNKSAKQKPAKQLFSWTSSIDHGPYKDEKPQKITKVEQPAVKFQKKSGVTNEPQQREPQSSPKPNPVRFQKRVERKPFANLQRQREALDQITQRKHKYETEDLPDSPDLPDLPEERKADQRGRDEGDDGKEWKLEDSIPGIPDQDYATHQTLPQTNFKCTDHKLPGYYGDPEVKCQVFHVCQADGRQDTFLCPVGTVFNQKLFVCDWWNNFRCEETSKYYELNANLYDYSKEGKSRGIRSDEPIESEGPPIDEPEVNSALKGGSIYSEEETKGGSHRSQVYFETNPSAANVNRRDKHSSFWKRKSQTAEETEKQDSKPSSTSSQLSDEDDYWSASQEAPISTFAKRLSSLTKQVEE